MRIAFGLGLLVVLLGAYTRLVDAGLGCPDWPGCYGFLTVPDSAESLAKASERFPDSPVDAEKAWVEMVHRYLATTLGLAILFVLALAIIQKQQLKYPLALFVLVVAQGIFGAWTVTLKLWPQIVTLHLLGGFATVSLIWLYMTRREDLPTLSGVTSGARKAAIIVFSLLVVQITLGGWTSSNYAALACPDFPLCHGNILPEMDLIKGFNFLQTIGPNYLGGELSAEARVAIQIIHRLGAIVLAGLTIWLLTKIHGNARTLVALLLVTQLGLGISNVLLNLTLSVAVAHNFVALLLLLSILSVVAQTRARSSAG